MRAMNRAVHVRPAAADRERGSVTTWLALGSIAMILAVGVAVDLTGQVHAQQHARDVAYQAARAGGQQLDNDLAVRGLEAKADPYQAASAARTYLAAADVSGTVYVRGGDTVVVETTDTYQTKFLSMVGLNRMTVTGQGEVRVVRVVGGIEQ